MKCDFTIARRGVARLLAVCSGLLRDNEQTTQLRADYATTSPLRNYMLTTIGQRNVVAFVRFRFTRVYDKRT